MIDHSRDQARRLRVLAKDSQPKDNVLNSFLLQSAGLTRKKDKIPVYIVLSFCAVIFLAGFYLYLDRRYAERYKAMNDKYLADTSSLKAIAFESGRLKDKVESNAREYMGLKEDMGRLKQDNQSLSGAVKELETRKNELEEQLSNRDRKISELEQGNAAMQEKFFAASDNLESKLSEIEDRIGKMSAVQSQPQTALSRIILYNPEYNFVVVNIGERHGIRTGNELEVTRAGRRIAVLQVVESRAGISACDIKEVFSPFAIGDNVRIMH